jgi:hypothetical protein
LYGGLVTIASTPSGAFCSSRKSMPGFFVPGEDAESAGHRQLGLFAG